MVRVEKEMNTLDHVASVRSWLATRRGFENWMGKLGRWVPADKHHEARALWVTWMGYMGHIAR